MLTVQKCCCLLSLRTGTLCIGVFCLTSSLIHFFTSLGTMSSIFVEEDYKIMMVLHFELSIIDGCMLYGAMKDSKYFLIPWLVLYGSLALMLIFVLITLAVIFPIALLYLLIPGPFIYLWFCVWSYYVSLDPTRNVDVTAVYRDPPAYENPQMKYPEVV